ncbi:TPA: fucose isomerase [bacterium]|jgi:L-fucose mutarotase|nr:fucose isomerase [bacterium]
MLKGIPPVISPDLMYALMNMGHGDEIVIADGNFPADTNAQRLIRADGLDVCTVLKAVAQFFPLDTFAEDNAVIMEVVDPSAPKPEIWKEFKEILSISENKEVKLTPIERFSFYDRAKKAYCVVATSEKRIYANIILKKGVV